MLIDGSVVKYYDFCMWFSHLTKEKIAIVVNRFHREL